MNKIILVICAIMTLRVLGNNDSSENNKMEKTTRIMTAFEYRMLQAELEIKKNAEDKLLKSAENSTKLTESFEYRGWNIYSKFDPEGKDIDLKFKEEVSDDN